MYQHQLDPKQEEKKRTQRQPAATSSPAADLELSPRPGIAEPGPLLLSLQGRYGNRYVQRMVDAARQGSPALAIQAKKDEPRPNSTGLPDGLKAGVENLSGLSLDDVRVYYNSSKPAELQALAYTQGTEIHIARGQERHLPHEAWHVVQQAQGRVQPTILTAEMAINDSPWLENEANVMGRKATEKEFRIDRINDALSDQPSHSSRLTGQQRRTYRQYYKKSPIQRMIIFGGWGDPRADQLKTLVLGAEIQFPGSTKVQKAWKLLKREDFVVESSLFSRFFGTKKPKEQLILAGHGAPGIWNNLGAVEIVNRLLELGFSNERFDHLVILGCNGATVVNDSALILELNAELNQHPETRDIKVTGVRGILTSYQEGTLKVGPRGESFASGSVTVSADSTYIPPNL